ncbi:hypothetical protein Vadar_007135 [Vaccinium darrowii]|uniref:Uncharacterized protein n=1 Tax=Vaccinium darrowii TaxID=229202 RepID=A0ACB7Z2Y3_9ERIC|nr:hypothetical protein Vadar_007135 [Vaccinium darrowii]
MNDILEEEIGPTQPGNGVEVGKKANAKAGNAKVANGKAQHKRANQSMVWDHFSIITEDGDPNLRATCDYCQADYACHSTKNGTSAMKSHLTYQCRGYELSQKNLDKKQKTLGLEPVKGEDGLETGGKLSIVNFSVEACVKALAEMKCYDKEVVDLMVEEIKNEMGELYGWYEKNGSHALPLNDLGQSTNKTMDEEEGMDSLEKMKFRFKMHLEEENNLYLAGSTWRTNGLLKKAESGDTHGFVNPVSCVHFDVFEAVVKAFVYFLFMAINIITY